MVNPDRNLYEPPYDDALLYDSDLEPERPRSRPLVVLLGIVVLAAFAGVVWVAYNQGVKQGQRGTPLLTADAGPTRIVPDPSATSTTINPAPDKSYERLWGETQEREGQENVLPQAEQPRSVPAPQDVAIASQTKPDGSAGGPLEAKASDVPPLSEDPRMDSTVGSVSSLAETGSPKPITATPPSPKGTPAVFGPRPQSEDITAALPPAESVTPPTTAQRTVTTTTTQPKPIAPKPVTLTQTPPAAAVSKPAAIASTSTTEKNASAGPKVLSAETPATAPVPSESKTASLTAPSESSSETAAAPAPAAAGGSVMIQLGSFPNDALAASAWSKIKSSNQELLGSYSPSIKPAEIPGKGTWYRLRVGGFADKSSAKSVCDQLASSGQACIVAAK